MNLLSCANCVYLIGMEALPGPSVHLVVPVALPGLPRAPRRGSSTAPGGAPLEGGLRLHGGRGTGPQRSGRRGGKVTVGVRVFFSADGRSSLVWVFSEGGPDMMLMSPLLTLLK